MQDERWPHGVCATDRASTSQGVPEMRFLRGTHQVQRAAATALLASGGQGYGVRSDQTVILSSSGSAAAYPDPLRRVSYFDAETKKRLKFLTDNFTLPAHTIAQIYKQRWQVELFFKWIKQHLRIKAFYGTSENAVKTQIWVAVSVYVLVARVRKQLGLEASLYQILQILSRTLFERTPILRALQTSDWDEDSAENRNQVILFDF
jgi:hypothetical protein